ncbi:MAG TPA: LppX_LprAFG lipoprotein, partial [Devosia sp.]|nr:LppX_LprAFG lipoprotein [Devosia sp.]
DIYDPSAILNPDTGLAHMLANFSDAKAVKHETIDGQDTIRVTGNVAAAAVQKLAPQLVGTDPKPTTLWIQADDPHQLVQAELEQSPGNTVQMTLSNWDAPVSVEKPAV